MAELKNLWLVVEDEGSGLKKRVPVLPIAMNRAEYYADRDFGGNVEQSLAIDTLPLFSGNRFEIVDWASNNMDWSDLEHLAVDVPPYTVEPDWQEALVNGPYEWWEEQDG